MVLRILQMMPFKKGKLLFMFGFVFGLGYIVRYQTDPSVVTKNVVHVENDVKIADAMEPKDVTKQQHALSDEIPKQAIKTEENEQVCVHPTLDLWHPVLAPYFKSLPELECSNEKDWVYVSKGTFRISEEAVKKHGKIKCVYKPIIRGKDDLHTSEGATIEIEDGTPLTHDFFRAICTAEDKAKYENLHAGIALKKDVLERPKPELPPSAFGLNVLMFGFDSVSHMTWMRNFKETYKYFTETLGGVVLDGYNIVGDGTPQALLPILTGKTEWELPEARKGKPGAKPVDGHPFIWKEFQKNGYATLWGEGVGTIGVFVYRMKGFINPPVDHYMRPFYMIAEKDYKRHKRYCFGSKRRHQIMFDYNRQFFDMYPDRKKFSYIWHAEYTHGGYNEAQYADKDFKSFIEGLEKDGILNNTLLVLLSDHGARFQAVRKTTQGKYEERMPYMSFRFPPWFEKKYPEAMKNLRTNVKRLATPFDIHETLYDVLYYRGAGKGDISDRGISLFKEIPKERECKHADVEPHWCACLKWNNINVTDDKVKRAAQSLLTTINKLSDVKRSECEILTMDYIAEAVMLAQNEQVMKFKQSADHDGRVADLSDKMVSSDVLYQVTIHTQPNGGLYEATVNYLIKEDTFRVNDREISRINKYGNQPHCIIQSLPSIRPYCYCKTQLND